MFFFIQESLFTIETNFKTKNPAKLYKTTFMDLVFVLNVKKVVKIRKCFRNKKKQIFFENIYFEHYNLYILKSFLL